MTAYKKPLPASTTPFLFEFFSFFLIRPTESTQTSTNNFLWSTANPYIFPPTNKPNSSPQAPSSPFFHLLLLSPLLSFSLLCPLTTTTSLRHKYLRLFPLLLASFVSYPWRWRWLKEHFPIRGYPTTITHPSQISRSETLPRWRKSRSLQERWSPPQYLNPGG